MYIRPNYIGIHHLNLKSNKITDNVSRIPFAKVYSDTLFYLQRFEKGDNTGDFN